MRTYTAVALICASLPLVAAADSMRCGKWVVSETSSSAEILQKCGEPQRKDVKTEDVLGKNIHGNAIKLGTTVIEHWRYQRGGSLPMMVKVVDGKVVSVARAE